MKIVGLLTWYDESPTWLSAAISSHAKAIDHLVAVDGAYGLYPDGGPHSGIEQHEAVVGACYAANIGLTLHSPDHVWIGNEVEKRTFMFRIAEQVGADWLFVIDADQVLKSLPPDFRERLTDTELNAAETSFFERANPQATEKMAKAAQAFVWDRKSNFRVRNIFRALPGLHCAKNHYTYVTGDGRKLWGNATYQGHDIEPCLDLTDLKIEHRTQYRDMARRESAKEFYRRRDATGAELSNICGHCKKEVPTTRSMPCDWELHPEGLTSGWVDLCMVCSLEQDRANRETILGFGLDPDTLMLGQKVEIRA